MKKIKINQDEKFEKLFSGIANDIVKATLQWRLYQKLSSAVTDYEIKFNQSHCGFPKHSHFSISMMRLETWIIRHSLICF